ncbi:regulatory protein, arsR family [Amycolatopsis xylanica]|uniref:Regulatory protein, arsR family n=1 Tax=Amycolatopsis xylanica TaxID=589385 RepID=A0A1H2ZZ17_9PSEU|nr:DUF5937 family protein [Amycolatopsis xylanica]SDX21909.1 regulatory protein, arsR family [Amycolatopsis xylanica]
MIELVFDVKSAQRVRFGISPLEEVLGAVQTVLGLRGHPSLPEWLRRPRELPAELSQVLGARHYLTDFLCPPPSGPETTARAQLARVRETPPEQVEQELAMVDADLSGLPRDPAEARDLLADQLEQVWTELVEPHWPRMHRLLAADIEYRSRRLAEQGTTAVFQDLHPRLRLVGDTLLIDIKDRSRVELESLLLIPAVFAWPSLGVITLPPWQPAILYPARGVAELWAQKPKPSDALANVVGRTKAALLTTLDEPASTQALAIRLELSPGTVSEHLGALKTAGLLDSARRGHAVHYRRTDLGDALLRGIV